jgi:hypothetical protein
MVDAPWLSPGEHSGAFFIFGHWELGIGHLFFPRVSASLRPPFSLIPLTHFSFLPLLPAPCSPASLLPIAALLLGVETTSGKGRLPI